MHGRSRMTIYPRIPTMPGRSTSGFHRLGRRIHWLHQARSAGGVPGIMHGRSRMIIGGMGGGSDILKLERNKCKDNSFATYGYLVAGVLLLRDHTGRKEGRKEGRKGAFCLDDHDTPVRRCAYACATCCFFVCRSFHGIYTVPYGRRCSLARGKDERLVTT